MRLTLPFLALLSLTACAQAGPAGPPQPPPQAALPAPAPVQDGYFSTSDGVRLHYLQAGQGAVLLFVPGWDMPAWIFNLQIEEFSRTYRVVALDPRGQGDSDIPAGGYEPHRRGQDIAELIAHLDAGPVVLVGWSLGVLDSLAYVADHGDAQVSALVLIDNSVGELPAPLPEHPARLPRRHGRAPAPVSREVYMHSFVASMFRTPQPSDYIDRLTEATLRVPAYASKLLISYPEPRSYWRDAVYSTSRPVLYVVRPALSGQAHNLQANHPACEAVVLTGVGHALFVDDPGRFDALMRDFLRRRVFGS